MKITDNYRIIKSDKLNLALEVRKIRTKKKTGEQYESWQTIGWYGDYLQAALQGAAKHIVFDSIEDLNNLNECISRLKDIEQIVRDLNIRNIKF